MRNKIALLLLLLLTAVYVFAYSFGQNKVNSVPENWSMMQTMHFDIYFPAGEDEFGKTVALMSEDIYYSLRKDLTFPADSRIPIIFYRSKNEFQNTNIIYPLLTEGVGGFTESLRNRVVVPFEGSYAKLEELLVHELTHAYINALDSKSIGAASPLRPTSFPFWFSEGLPEFLSLGGEDAYNNMFVLDLVVNDQLNGLETSSGYYAYRLGESFLTFIASVYGKEKVAEFYYAIRAVNNLDNATQKVFGMKFKDLESRWRFQLKREYFPYVNTHDIPLEDMEKRTDSEKDGSYINSMPRFSPDGSRYVYFGTAGARYSIWLAGLHGLSEPKKIITGEATGKMEEFHYFRSNFAWFPDNKRVAFAAKTSEGDRIHILDVDKERIVETLDIKGFEALYELDVSPSGESMVFAAQKDLQCDLYLYDLNTQSLKQLTNDFYDEAQPRFVPESNTILFSSERFRNPFNTRTGFFANLVSEIYTLDLTDGKAMQLTFEQKDCTNPMILDNGKQVLYLSAEDGITNLFSLDLEKNLKARVTNVLAGVSSADITLQGKHLILSNFFKGAWDIYFTGLEADELVWDDYPASQEVSLQNDLMQSIDLSLLDYYPKRPRIKPKRVNPAASYDLRRPLLNETLPFELAPEDSLQLGRDFSFDDKPQEKGSTPEVKPYKTKFSLDSLWGGLAYSSGVGTIGYIELSLSDMMGNHGIGINAGIAGKLEDSNILLTYLYLKNRMDYGVGAYNLFDEVYYREPLVGADQYYRYRERQSGLYFLLRYPLNRFLRIETDHMLYQRGQYLSDWIWTTPTTGNWGEEQDIGQDIVYTPGVSVVHDNSLYGSTGPLLGWRTMYNVSATLADGKIDRVTNYLDWRSYTLFSKRYSLAFRAIAGLSIGDHPQRFDLTGYYGVRGFDGDISGKKKALATAELRFPFFEYINLAFPVPLNIPNIRGSLFADIGTVFDEFDEFQATNDGKLKDLHMSYGFGPRLDMGYVILRLDIAWLTDLSRNSKPTYYLSLSEDF